jgi:hypothetical protein
MIAIVKTSTNRGDCLIPAVTAVTSPKNVINFSLRVELDSPCSLVVDQLSSLIDIVYDSYLFDCFSSVTIVLS